jgi:hypothetical protein
MANLLTAQVCSFYKEGLDTLKLNQIKANVYLGFYFSQDALQYLYLTSNASGLYVGSRSTLELSGVINLQGLKKRSTSNSGYLIARSNLWRHRFIDDTIRPSKINMEPFVMFQFDENRGINQRYQAGLYAVPTLVNTRKISVEFGLGLLEQVDCYDLLPPDYDGWWDEDRMKQIREDIQVLDPDGDGYAWLSSTRAGCFLGMTGSFGKFDLNLIASLQQPFRSSFHGTALYDRSADFRTPYPCITVESIFNVSLFRWFSLNLRYYMQHDRNQYTFYLPYFVYSITTGVTFSM